MLICDSAGTETCKGCIHSTPHKTMVDYYNDHDDKQEGCEEVETKCHNTKKNVICVEVEVN
jgi:hypothetical protein